MIIYKVVYAAKRYAMKDKSTKDRVVYKCIKSKANVEDLYGS